MEALSNVASAASKAIWGDSTQSNDEPVNGKTGDTSAGEPYDAGNLDSTGTDSTKANSDLPGNTTSTDSTPIEHDIDKNDVTLAHQSTSGFSSDKPVPSNDTSGFVPTPSVGTAPASSTKDETSNRQGAEKHQSEPEQGPKEHTSIKRAKQGGVHAQDVDNSGPGPQPLSEIGGTTGVSGAIGKAIGKDDPDNYGRQTGSHGSGTGEEYVNSSGMKVDGGDFDTSKPGAAREADRLPEDRTVHYTAESSTIEDGNTEDPLEDKAHKPSLKARVKAKLHLDKKDKSDL